MERAQSTWLTSAPLPCPPFHKHSHPAEQWQTRGFTRAAPPPRDTDLVPFCTEDSFIPPASAATQRAGGSGTSHTPHPGSSSYLPENKTLVRTTEAGRVLLRSGSSYHSQVEKLTDLGDWRRWKDFWSCRRGPIRFPELGSRLWVQGSALPPDSHYRSHHASLLPAEKRWDFFLMFQHLCRC